MYKKIVVPVDMGQLEKGEKILARAKALLDAEGQIILINVAETVPSYITVDLPVDFIELSLKDAEVKLKELDARLDTKAVIETRIGAPAREILDAADRHGADLIVIGSHRPDFYNYLIGATADRVVRHSKCSVLVDR